MGLPLSHPQSRRATSNTDDNSVMSRSTDPRAFTFNRASRHAAMSAAVTACSFLSSGSACLSNAASRIVSFCQPRFVGVTSREYCRRASRSVLSVPTSPDATASSSMVRRAAHSAASRLVGAVKLSRWPLTSICMRQVPCAVLTGVAIGGLPGGFRGLAVCKFVQLLHCTTGADAFAPMKRACLCNCCTCMHYQVVPRAGVENPRWVGVSGKSGGISRGAIAGAGYLCGLFSLT